MEKGLVSIIIATHNRAESLQSALISALNQAYKHVEIIVIANGCQDNTTNIVNQLKNNALKSGHDTPIRYLEFADTLGGAKARNIGIDHAQGEYIAFLDDDDRWHHDKIRCQVQLLKDNKYSIISSNFSYAYTHHGKSSDGKKSRTAYKTLITLPDLYYENTLGGFSFCMTKKAYIGNSRVDDHLAALQDWDLWLKILINTHLPAYISQENHVYYHLGEYSISANFEQVIQAQQQFLTNWHPMLDKPSVAFHKMRTRCLSIKTQAQGKYKHYFLAVPTIIRTVFNSPYRYNIKKHIHFLLLPIVNIDAARVWIWSKFK